jgi:Ssp1 endopeptidase immunity protein Rap1a
MEFAQMIRTAVLVAFLAALIFSGLGMGGEAVAEVIAGSKLIADCRDGDNPNARDSTYKWGTCFGYINGVADALVPAELYCLPKGASAGQVLDVAKLYIQDHPDKQYLPAPQLIVNALKEKFPCN